MVSIRSYRLTDFDAVIAVFLAAVPQVAAGDYTPAQIDAWARLDRDSWASRRRGRATWVAVIGRSPAGFTDLEPNGHLDMLYVHRAHQRVGIASTLLATLEAEPRDKVFPGCLPRRASQRGRSLKGAAFGLWQSRPSSVTGRR
jgi:putative acetyltransferase